MSCQIFNYLIRMNLHYLPIKTEKQNYKSLSLCNYFFEKKLIRYSWYYSCDHANELPSMQIFFITKFV